MQKEIATMGNQVFRFIIVVSTLVPSICSVYLLLLYIFMAHYSETQNPERQNSEYTKIWKRRNSEFTTNILEYLYSASLCVVHCFCFLNSIRYSFVRQSNSCNFVVPPPTLSIGRGPTTHYSDADQQRSIEIFA